MWGEKGGQTPSIGGGREGRGVLAALTALSQPPDPWPLWSLDGASTHEESLNQIISQEEM